MCRRVAAALVVGFCVVGAHAQSKRTMVVADIGAGQAPRDMSRYDMTLRSFGLQRGLDGLADALNETRFLLIRQNGGPVLEAIVADPRTRKAAEDLLQRGGTIYFDIELNVSSASRAGQWLAGIGAAYPGRPTRTTQLYSPKAHPAATHPLARTPNTGVGGGYAYQYWPKAPAGCTTLLVDPERHDRIGMLVVDNVLGKGRVLFSCAKDLWERSSGGGFVENMLTGAFGPLPGPGLAVGVFDRYEVRSPIANTVHLQKASRTRWHVPDATHRKAFLVSEPIGMARDEAYVEVRWQTPADADKSVPRALTAGALELHAQWLGGDRFAVAVPLREYDDQLIYLYVGGSSAPSVHGQSLFQVRKQVDGWRLDNETFEAVLAPSLPWLWRIGPHGGGRNLLATWGPSERWMAHEGTNFAERTNRESKSGHPMPTGTVSLAADGSVVKTLRYSVKHRSRSLTADISLIRGARALFYDVRGSGDTSLSIPTTWAIGGSCAGDVLWYESAEGLKKLPVGAMRSAATKLAPRLLKESWYAIADPDAGDVGGQFITRGPEGPPAFNQLTHLENGQQVTISYKLSPAGVSGGWVAAKGGAREVRRAYVEWRNPPVVTAGPAQARGDVPTPPVPKLGRDFLRIMHHFRTWSHANIVTGLDPFGEAIMDVVERVGSNGACSGWMTVDEFYPPFVESARRRGMTSAIWLYNLRYGGVVDNRRRYLASARKGAAWKADICFLLDEFCHNRWSEAGAADFKRRTGLVLPKGTSLDLSRLPDETIFQALMWRAEVTTELARTMNEIVLKARPDATTVITTSPDQLAHDVNGFNDLEPWSRWLGTTSTDLYMTDFNKVRAGIQWVRGAQGNDRPVLTTHGGRLPTPAEMRLNYGMHLMNGTNSLAYFNIWYHRTFRNLIVPVIRENELLRDSVLGDVLARGRLVRHAAVLHERASWIDGLRRGELRGRKIGYQVRARRAALLRNLPTDMLFASHLARELPNYKVLVVPSGRAMSERSAKTIAAWARGGGAAIISGEALQNPVLAELCGVSAAGEPMQLSGEVRGLAGALAGKAVHANSRCLRMTAPGAKVLASFGGRAIVIARAAGKGTAVAVSMFDVPEGILRPLVLALGGPLPVAVDAASEGDVRVTAIVDGRRAAIGVLNEHLSEAKTVAIGFDGLGLGGDLVATNMHGGARQPARDRVTITLPSGHWRFLVLEPATSAAPLAQPGAAVAGAAYARRRGMTFLRIAEDKPAAAAVARQPGRIYVAVLKNLTKSKRAPDVGGLAILRALGRQSKVAPRWVEDLTPETLAGCDVVVVPNMIVRAPNLSLGWEKHVRRFVRDGGGALLVHHSAGLRTAAAPAFPEIAAARECVALRGMKVVADHAVVNGSPVARAFPYMVGNPAFQAQIDRLTLAPGTTFQSGFPDYIVLVPGPAAAVLARSERRGDTGGDVTLAVGAVGKGKAVLAGMSLGSRCHRQDDKWVAEEVMSPEEEAILVNSVFWLAERK